MAAAPIDDNVPTEKNELLLLESLDAAALGNPDEVFWSAA